jgi:spore maturation protein CgeB
LGLFIATNDHASLPDPIAKLNRGGRYGLDLYRALRSGRMVVNQELPSRTHGGISLRIFESTGVGALTIAAQNPDVEPFFVRDREVVSYRGSTGLIERIDYFLANPEQGSTIAKLGQERCLTTHEPHLLAEPLLRMFKGKPKGLVKSFRRLWHRIHK